MKAIECIKAFCSNWNDCEKCDYVDVPEFESRGEYEEWAMHYWGFVPVSLKYGKFYLVMWDDDFYLPNSGVVEPDCVAKQDESTIVRFYEIEQ